MFFRILKLMVFRIEATSCPLSSNLLSAELQQRILNDFAQAANQLQEVLNLDQRALMLFWYRCRGIPSWSRWIELPCIS
jgi:hypothetical protein